MLLLLFPEPASEAAQASSDGEQTPDKNKKKNRCFSCRKKVGLTGEQLSRLGCVGADRWMLLQNHICQDSLSLMGYEAFWCRNFGSYKYFSIFLTRVDANEMLVQMCFFLADVYICRKKETDVCSASSLTYKNQHLTL